MSDEMGYAYTVHKYRDLSRWEFRYWDETDGEIDSRHIVVWDTTNDQSFCVISFAELRDEMRATNRVREYAEIDANRLLSDDEFQRRIAERHPDDSTDVKRESNAEFRRIWTDAIADGIMRGLNRTRRFYS